MEISLVNLTSNIPKTSGKNSENPVTSNDNTFKNALNSISSKKTSAKDNDASSVNNYTHSANSDTIQNNAANESNPIKDALKDGQTIDNNVKDAILDAAKADGFSEEDLSKIKKLLEDSTNVMQLLLMLMQNTNGNANVNLEQLLGKNSIQDILKEIDNVLNSKLNSGDILKLKDKLNSELSSLNLNQLFNSDNTESSNTIETLIGKAVKDLNLKVSNDDLKSLSSSIESSIVNLISKNVNTPADKLNISDSKDIIKNYLIKLLNTANTKNATTDTNTNLIQLNDKAQQENNNLILSSSETKQQSTSDKSSKDESFLSNLAGNDSKSSSTNFSRVTNFINQLTNANTINGTVSVENANPVLNANNIQEDFIQTLKFMNTNDLQQLTVKIVPKELGEVVINLTLQGGNLKANITAANKDAYNLLNANLQDINNKLQNENIKIQNLTLNIYSEDTTFFKDGSQNQNQERNNHKASSVQNINFHEDEDSINNNLMEENSNVNLFA